MLRIRVAPRTSACILFAGAAGGAWGMGLARALAESFPESPTFRFGPTFLLVLTATAVGAAVDLWLSGQRSPVRDEWLCSAFAPLLLASIYVFWPHVAPNVGWTLLGGSLALAGLLVLRQARWESTPNSAFSYGRLVAIFLASVTLALYLRTLGPTVGQADTFEFQVVAPTLGVAHPTGYPLYILSGRLFSLLPYGSVAWRVNLTSAVFAAVAVVILYTLVYMLTARPMAALLASLAFAFSRVFWSQAVVAEVYALHNLFVVLVLLLLLGGLVGRWRVLPARSDGRRSSDAVAVDAVTKRTINPLYVLALALGLSFANHLTTALLLPAVVLALLFIRPRMSWRDWLIAAALFLLGLALYLYIYLRWPMLHEGVWMSPSEFWAYVTGQQFGGALRIGAWRTDPARYRIVERLLREPFGWPGLVLGAVGLFWLARKNWRAALVTLAAFLAYVWYALSYYVPDVSVFLLPSHLVLAIWLGLGIAGILTVMGSLARRAVGIGSDWVPHATARRWGAAVLVSLFALLPLWLLWSNFALVDQSGKRDAYAWGYQVLDLPLAHEAAVLADSVRIAPLYYLQRIEGRRSDLDLLVLADEATYRAELEARLAAGQTVYLARFLPGLEGRYHLRSLGPLTEVGTVPVVEPPPLDRTLGARFGPTREEAAAASGGTIELLGITGPGPGPDGGVGLTLYWRAEEPLGEVYHVRLRAVDDQGKAWWQEEGHHAANNYYPTVAWRPGEVVADYHEIPPSSVNPGTSSNVYTVQVGLFRPFSDAGLTTENGEKWYSVLTLDVPALADQSVPDHPLRAHYSDDAEAGWFAADRDAGLTVMGADLPDVVAAGAPVTLRLHSVLRDAIAVPRGSGNTGFQGHPMLTWTDRQGTTTEAPVVDTWGWSRLLLQAPALPGDYQLRLGFVDEQGRFLSAYCGWLARPTEDCALAHVRVTGAASSALANFDGKMLLLDAEFDLPKLSDGSLSPLAAGDNMMVTLHWQGLQSMEDDYTISVQLVGPDGRLHGQTDTWPVQGTLPTSQWLPDQRIVDPYEVLLEPDAPAGHYQVGVVVYSLGTQARMALVDGSGLATGDVAWVGEFDVMQR